MNTLSYRTTYAKKETHQPEWWIVDATDKSLGRLASEIAKVLRGKHKPTYTPHMDAGDCVVVLNSDQVHLSGNKWEDKKYISYSGYPGGQKVINARDLNARHPKALIEKAVKGMLPKNRLGRQMFKKLFVYNQADHPHGAQKPKELNI